MEFLFIDNEDAFLDEKESWDELYRRMPDATPFQTWLWNYSWWKNREPKDSLRVIKAYEGKKVYGYAPIVVKNGNAEFIGGRDIDYGRFLVLSKENVVIEGFIKCLLDDNLSLSLQEMAARNEQLHIVMKMLEKHPKLLIHKTTRTVNLPVSRYSSFDEYFLSLSQNMRQKTKKTIKRANEAGLIVQKEKVTDSLLHEIEAIFVSRQEVRGGSLDISWSFPILKDLSDAGLASIYVVRLEQRAVAFMVVLVGKDGPYTWLMALSNEVDSLYPGQLLNYHVIHDAFIEKDSIVDFMRGDYDFKTRWEFIPDTNYTVYVFKNIFSLIRRKTLFWIHPKAKRFVYAHPALLRQYKKMRRK